ncbi:MAG: replicative helicase [Pseudomonadota bacterium]
MSADRYYNSDYAAVDTSKITPHSLPAEKSVLGGLMLHNAAWDKIADKITAGDFYDKNHQRIFASITALAEQFIPFDVITIADDLDAKGLFKIGEISVLSYVSMLARDTPSAANIETYAQIVRDHSILRQLIDIGTKIADSAYQTQGFNTTELLDIAERQVLQIAEQNRSLKQGFKPVQSLLSTTVNKIHELFEHKSHITGMSTGFTDFDHMTSGLQPSDLIIIAGRPSMGKTSLAMNIAESVAIGHKAPVAIFSLEMSAESLMMRLLSSLGRIDQLNIRTGKLSDEDWPRLNSAVNILQESQLFIDDTPGLTPTELSAKARRLAREKGGLGLIVVDYLQLMQSPASGDNRVQQISDISRSLKGLAKELHVPLIALSQLNRNLEQRPNKRPMMADLRESGSIEQDADLIAFVYRDEVYNPDSPDKGTAEIIIGKQRNGPIGTVRVTFLGQFTRFESFTEITSYEDY